MRSSIYFSQNLLASHDIVAQRDYLPKLKDVPLEVDEDEETVKLVQLVKSQEPLVISHIAIFENCPDFKFKPGSNKDLTTTIQILNMQGNQKSAEPIVGATIKAEEGTGRILIARVMHGGAADRSGLIACGDEVIEVNGINVEGKTPNDVLKILVRASMSLC